MTQHVQQGCMQVSQQGADSAKRRKSPCRSQEGQVAQEKGQISKQVSQQWKLTNKVVQKCMQEAEDFKGSQHAKKDQESEGFKHGQGGTGWLEESAMSTGLALKRQELGNHPFPSLGRNRHPKVNRSQGGHQRYVCTVSRQQVRTPAGTAGTPGVASKQRSKRGLK